MSQQRVLIVEDDAWLAEQFTHNLTAAGYSCSVSSHASAAVIAIDDYKPDVIILDILLTGSTAFVLLHELQSYGDTSKLPVIICTNLASELSLDRLQSYGVRKVIDKTTMLPGDILAAVKAVL